MAFAVVWQSTLSFRQTLHISCELGMDTTKTVQTMFGKQSYRNHIFSFPLTIYIVCTGVSNHYFRFYFIFYAKIASPKEGHPPLSQQSPLKVEIFKLSPLSSSRPFWKCGWKLEGRGGGLHTIYSFLFYSWAPSNWIFTEKRNCLNSTTISLQIWTAPVAQGLFLCIVWKV